MSTLLERIVGLTAPDRATDAEILKAHCPGALVSQYLASDEEPSVFHAQALGLTDRSDVPRYTSSLDDTLALVAHTMPGWGYFLRHDKDSGYVAALVYPDAFRVTPGATNGANMAIALCAALLTAKQNARSEAQGQQNEGAES